MSPSLTPTSKRVLGLVLLVLGLPLACEELRERDDEAEGIHPSGWIEETSPQFHGAYLKSQGYPLGGCRDCHGDQYDGGTVEVSCTTSSCHTEGVEACGTCHGKGTDPRPATGAHDAHLFACTACHPEPSSAREAQHPNGMVDIAFTGLGLNDGSLPKWDAVSQTCSQVYCHGTSSPLWRTPTGSLPCDTCHEAPPTSHERWSVAQTTESCVNCHPGAGSKGHVDGKVLVAELACDTCHGSDPTGAPPSALDGSTSPSDRGVGAHARHLDPNLSGRIGKAVACVVCHHVPDNLNDAGHLDDLSPADVELPGQGMFFEGTGRCVTSCHWDKTPGPAFNDDSGNERACDACHGFPPAQTREGTPHPQVAGDLSLCVGCHGFDPKTHVDGKVDFAP